MTMEIVKWKWRTNGQMCLFNKSFNDCDKIFSWCGISCFSCHTKSLEVSLKIKLLALKCRGIKVKLQLLVEEPAGTLIKRVLKDDCLKYMFWLILWLWLLGTEKQRLFHGTAEDQAAEWILGLVRFTRSSPQQRFTSFHFIYAAHH